MCAYFTKKENISTYVVKPTNAHVYNVVSHIINYQHVSIAFAVIIRVVPQG